VDRQFPSGPAPSHPRPHRIPGPRAHNSQTDCTARTGIRASVPEYAQPSGAFAQPPHEIPARIAIRTTDRQFPLSPRESAGTRGNARNLLVSHMIRGISDMKSWWH